MFDWGADVERMNTTEENIFETNNINLIDFGFVTPYLSSKGGQKHIKKGLLDLFHGNLVFASVNQMKFNKTSRRDDMISLFYFLVYLLQEGKLPGIELGEDYNASEEFEKILQTKKSQGINDLCFGASKDLEKFHQEVFSYKFADAPNYEELRKMLNRL